MPIRVKADLLLFMVAIIWGISFVAQGVAGQYGIAYLFNGISFMLAGIILLPFVPRVNKISTSQWKWMFVAGIVLFIATAMQQVGMLYTKVANASFLTSLYAVFTPVLLWIGFREKPHWLDLIAVAIAGLGAFLLSTSGKFEVQPGDSIELMGSFFWAFHFVLLGKFASKFESISFASGQFIVSGAINFMVGLYAENVLVLSALPLLGAILFRATLSIGIGYTLQVWGQRHTPPTDAALILGLEAVFAVIAAWFVLGQSLFFIQILGCTLIFIAVLISQLKGWTSGGMDHSKLVEGR